MIGPTAVNGGSRQEPDAIVFLPLTVRPRFDSVARKVNLPEGVTFVCRSATAVMLQADYEDTDIPAWLNVVELSHN